MAKEKEIKFREKVNGRILEGQQNKIIFRIHRIPTLDKTAPYIVAARNISATGPFVNTSGHRYFTLEEAKRFCQMIAAGEITLEEIQKEFDAEDAAREQAAIQDVTERAKKFRDRLDAMGLKYRDLLELEVLAHSLGDMGHHILLGHERGEGWPNGT